MGKNQKLVVKVIYPASNPLTGWEGCGITAIALPALLYSLLKETIFRGDKKDIWRVQVISHSGSKQEVIHEEVFESLQEADRRSWQLTKLVNSGKTDFSSSSDN